jgi:RNA polymerase sigma-70 factor (sigma-E family)
MKAAEEAAFTAFVRGNGDSLLRFARLLIPDDGDAEEALQVALLRLTRHWAKRIDAPAAYVRATLVNIARDRGRRRHLVPVPVVREPPPGAAPDVADAAEARAELDALLALLPPRQRVTVVLRVLEDRSERDTADLLACSVGTVKSNLARGLQRLRERLDELSQVGSGVLMDESEGGVS